MLGSSEGAPTEAPENINRPTSIFTLQCGRAGRDFPVAWEAFFRRRPASVRQADWHRIGGESPPKRKDQPSAVSENPCTYVHLVSGPGRACSFPGESRGLVGKEKPVPHKGREEAIGFIHSSDEAGERRGNFLREPCVGTVTQAGVGYGGSHDPPSLPEVGAVCLNGHARICAGAAGNCRSYRDFLPPWWERLSCRSSGGRMEGGRLSLPRRPRSRGG